MHCNPRTQRLELWD